MRYHALSLLLLVSCGPQPTVMREFTLAFQARCDDEPVARVAVSLDGRPSGSTDSAGNLQVIVTGQEGQAFPLRVVCPEAYRSAEAPRLVRLLSIRGLGHEQGSPHMVIPVRCLPAERLTAVVVRAPEAPQVPVLLYGEEVARTDSGGVAHLLVQLPPHSRFALELDTRQHPRLRPQNPTKSFTVPDRAEVFLFEQPFAVDPEPPPVKRVRRRFRRRRTPQAPPPPSPRLPTRI